MQPTKPPAPGLGQRLRAARQIVFGREDGAVCCSFCARDLFQAPTIIVGPGVAICGDCAQMALASMGGGRITQTPAGMIETGLMIFDDPACLLPAHRAALQGDLSRIADELGCRLLSWIYTCAPPAGDRLTVELACAAGSDTAALVRRFAAAAKGPVGAEPG